uniref:ELMO domain-containing protein n=1 Tax=Lactuca sativa TaxID=4236 RepID=A0A9R1XCN6_LACSA|nr:hypothetical protein LSAT_V11C500291880 [Lactuca sativa]
MVGSRTLIGGIFRRLGVKRFESNKYLDYTLTPIQERLQRLQERLNIPFDEESLEHQQKALIDLWYLAYPDVKLQGLISKQWKDMGWHGVNPSTDFRGCGFISLENLLFLAKKFTSAFRRLLFKESGERATWKYPIASSSWKPLAFLLSLVQAFAKKKGNLLFSFAISTLLVYLFNKLSFEVLPQ